MSDDHVVILFHSSSYAIRAEKVLKDIAITGKLVPVPRELSSDCGVCLRISREDSPRALDCLLKQGIEFEGCRDLS